MNITIPKISSLNLPKTNLNNAFKISFQGKSDIVSFSDAVKERNVIIQELLKIGKTKGEAQDLISKYYKTPRYYELINGKKNGEDEELEPSHFVNVERNLTPTEAIVYEAYNMDQYYVQHGNWNFPDNPTTTDNARDYDLGEMDFLPLDLAKYINDDIDVVLSGMILKGKLDPETAQRTAKYYNIANDKFLNYFNLKEAEYTAYFLSQKLDKLDYLTSSKKDEKADFVNGLTEPLTDEEAVNLVLAAKNKRPDKKSASILRSSKGIKEKQNIKKIPVKYQIKNFEDAINFVRHNVSEEHYDFLDDISLLDNDKFYQRYYAGALQYDVLMSDMIDRALRKKNIQVLNNTSVELLNKMTSGKRDEIGHFMFLRRLLETEDLDYRIQTLEKYKDETPIFFDSMTKEAVMDYLTNSDFYSKAKTSYEKFLDEISGNNPDNRIKLADIVEFPNN